MTLKFGQIVHDKSGHELKPPISPNPLLYGAVAEVLHRRGYATFPIKQGTKIPAVRHWNKPGGGARRRNWHSSFPNHNVGILCGSCVAIDIDCDDPMKAERVHGIALEIFGGDPPIRHRGTARRLMLYRAWQKAKTHHYEGCDIIGAGSQFVAYGMHNSGTVYEWTGPGPFEIDLMDLPVATPESLDALNDELAKLLGPLRRSKGAMDRRPGPARLSVSVPQTPVQRDQLNLILDGRDAELAGCVFHVWATGEQDAHTIAKLAWALFTSRVDLTRGRRNGLTPWSLNDAYEKAVFLLKSGKIRPKPGYLATEVSGSHLPPQIDLFNKAVSEICSLDGLSRSADRISRVMAGIAANSGVCFATAPTLAKWLDIHEDNVTKQRSCLVKKGLWSREYDASQVGALAYFRPQIAFALDLAAGVVAKATRKSSVVVDDPAYLGTLEEQVKHNHDVSFEFLAGNAEDGL